MYFLSLLFFKVYFTDCAITVVPVFSPLCPPLPCSLPPSNIPSLSSCTWIIHINSLASPFTILFLTSPCLFCTYNLCFLFPLPFSPFSPFPLPADNPPCDLHFCESVPVLVVRLVCFYFCFSGSVVNSCEFVVILLFIVLIFSFSLDNISYNKGWVMMNSFKLTLSGKHFICPSILMTALLDR